MTQRLANILISAFPDMLAAGFKITIPLTVLSFLFGMILALLLAIVQVANIKVLKQISQIYIWFFRGTPLLVQLFIIYFGLPSVGIVLPAFPAAVIAFGMNVAAYNAEAVRAAILAVPVGQTEAAYLIGLTYPRLMVRIVLPQAFPIAFPSLFNNLISLLKDTSLASCITIVEVMATAKQIIGWTYESLALYIEAAIIYLMFSTVLTWIQGLLEKRLGWEAKEERPKERVKSRAEG